LINNVNFTDLKKLHEILYERSGLYFGESRFEFLNIKLLKRMEYLKISDTENYFELIHRNREEFQNLLNEMTINETYFFRELNYLETYLDKIFSKQMLETDKIKIVSSACSSGEEAYSLAILIREKYPFMKNRIEIIGIDIDSSMIEKAKKGEYREFSLRATPKNFIDKYFNRENNYYLIASEIRNMLKFYNMNIFDDKFKELIENSEIILSRNVLIYFDNDSRKKALNIYYDGLNNNGILMLGKSESIFSVNNRFKIVHYPQVIFYKKEEETNA
jgi:chemotaxis protein methyltransferase CheR